MNPSALSPLTMCVGLLCGISGVAGGVFEVPIMIGLLGTGSHVAVATSSAIVCLASLLGIAGRGFSFSQEVPAIKRLVHSCCHFFRARRRQVRRPRLSVQVSRPVF